MQATIFTFVTMTQKQKSFRWVILPLLLGVVLHSSQAFECQEVGVFPDKNDCRSLYFCAEDQLDNPHRETCFPGTHYDAAENICKLGSDCARHIGPESLSFPCSEAGKFPDPEDCHSYYYCSGANTMSAHISCFSGNGYFDPSLQICMMGGCTNAPIPTAGPIHFTCTHSGFFPDPEDCRSYYRCDPDLSVHHGICFGGMGHFEPTTKGCELGTCSSNTEPTATPATGAFQCMTAGVFRDPLDKQKCRGFIRCDADLHATRYECNVGEYFDVNTNLCKVGKCPDKQAGGANPQILGDPVPTQAVKTTKATVDEFTTSKDNLGFVYCTISGVYPDPKNCRDYYRCNDFGMQYHGTCSIFGHYDPTLQGCLPGICFN